MSTQALQIPAGVSMPARPPEAYLAELRENGFTGLDNVIDNEALQRIRQAALSQIEQMEPAPPTVDDRFGIPNSLSWSADVCRAVTHPVALWILRTYMNTPDIHYCHQPGMTVLRPAKALIGTYPESGWHSDYPYHQDVFPANRLNDATVYGVQYNICIDEFRADNAATQYVPGSHLQQQFPPLKLNEGGTRMGVSPHDKVEQMLAPAGSALIYDSRTWHRACPELNVSGKDRMAILNAVCPSWIRPMLDKQPGTDLYQASDMAAQLNEREQQEINRLCHRAPDPAPQGAPAILAKAPSPRRLQL